MRFATKFLSYPVPYRALRLLCHSVDPVTVLCYHTLRPDNEEIDAWTALKMADFEQQIVYLKKNYDIVNIDDVLDGAGRKGARPRAVITFDDGDVGLHSCLLPFVERLKVPVTVYIATGQIQTGRAYWFDCVMNALQVEGSIVIDLRDAGLRRWTIGPETGLARWRVISDILETLKCVNPKRRDALALSVIGQAGVRDKDLRFTRLGPMTLEQLQDLASSNWVTIGAHSHCHNLLDQISIGDATRSIADSRTLLKEWTGQPVRHFAYPNGNFNDDLIKVVADLGFASAAGVSGLWFDACNAFPFPRIMIGRYEEFDRFRLRLVAL